MDSAQRLKIGPAIGKIASGVFIITLKDGANENAILASWVQQASFDPPAITFAIKKGRTIESLLKPDASFCLNVVPEDGSGDFFKAYGKGFAPGEDPFAGQDTRRGITGAAILTTALAYLEGRVVSRMDAGDHMVFVGQVNDGQMLTQGKPYVHIRKDGFSY